MSGPESEWTVFAELSRKHRDVLDLLIEHKTSKEISRILQISPHTVDQRLDSARSRLGLGSRSELAAAYRRYLEHSGEIYERLTYENFHIGVEAFPLDDAVRGSDDQAAVAGVRVQDQASGPASADGEDGIFLERSGNRFGQLADKAVIVLVAVLILGTLVAGFGNLQEAARGILD
jgi:DNA-binding CsgD family transcriptional regulator